MISTFINAWKIADLRKKMLFTALIVLIFRIGAAIPVPFTNITDGITPEGSESFMNYLNMMTGEAFNYGTIFAMGVTPYINSSIIIQLLSVAIPALEKLSKEGEEGRKKMATITRYTTIALALMQSTAYFIYLRAKNFVVMDASGQLFTGISAVLQGLVVILVLTAGSAFIMWLGEQVNDKGIGNGISIILFAGIVARIPTLCVQMYGYLEMDEAYYALVPIVVVLLLAMIAYIVWMDNAERRIPVQYAKRVVGRKMYGGQATHIPLKVNQAGVIPVIFAMAFLQFPLTITYFMNAQGSAAQWIEKWLSPTGSPGVWVYAVFNVILIIFFTYFYTSVTFNPVEVAQNMKANGGFIPGIRPGKATIEYLNRVMTRITFVGALFLAAVAVLPTIVSQLGGLNFHFGGTSLLIAVGVALDTMKQLENQMVMRNYSGFLK